MAFKRTLTRTEYMDAMQSEDLKSSGEHLEKAPVVPTLALSAEDKALEKRLIWKLDLLLVPICFLLCVNIDKIGPTA